MLNRYLKIASPLSLPGDSFAFTGFAVPLAPLLKIQKPLASQAYVFLSLFAYKSKLLTLTGIKKPTPRSGFLCFKWCLQESNQGHMDFQSIALPTELRYHTRCANIDSFLLFAKINS